jgi:hypothetical protein
VDGGTYELDDHLIAMHGAAHTDSADAPVASLEGGTIRVLRAGAESHASDQVGPVYRAGPHGPIAAPTGRVFLRFREGTDVERKRDEIEAAGFTLESVPGYAPHAAWLRPTSGRVADALVDLDRLRRLPDVEHVEPQLVTEAARRE